jgi:hypothetical protein
MTQSSLKERLAVYLRAHHGWIANGDLQRLVMASTNYTAQNVGRRLRELATEGVLDVQYRKNHAFYRARQVESPAEANRRQLGWFNSLAV